VISALLMKANAVKREGGRDLEIWGTGTPRREFLHVDDCADALVHLMRWWSAEGPVNVGCGEDISIEELARLVMSIVGLEGDLVFDRSKPDGTPRKLLDVSVLRELGWSPSIPLKEGLVKVLDDVPLPEAA
jgi:GDP-L-fucose synthase